MTAARQKKRDGKPSRSPALRSMKSLSTSDNEAEDVGPFWRLALREARNPGCLSRERRKYFALLPQ
jgi:hypothetical protein